MAKSIKNHSDDPRWSFFRHIYIFYLFKKLLGIPLEVFLRFAKVKQSKFKLHSIFFNGPGRNYNEVISGTSDLCVLLVIWDKSFPEPCGEQSVRLVTACFRHKMIFNRKLLNRNSCVDFTQGKENNQSLTNKKHTMDWDEAF